MLKKLYPFLILQLLTTTTCLPLFATISPKVPQDPHQFSLGLEFFHYKYREPGLMEYKGVLYGANAAYNYTFSDNFSYNPTLGFLMVVLITNLMRRVPIKVSLAGFLKLGSFLESGLN